MTYVSNAIDIDECSREVEFPVLWDQDWSAAQYPEAMFDGSEAIIDVAHIPMNPVIVLATPEKLEVAIEHLPLERIVVIGDICEIYALLFGNLMNRKGLCLA